MFKPCYKQTLLKPLTTRAVALRTFYPTEIAQLYSFPTSDGTGQRVGIIELGGGYRPNDLQIYFQNLGIRSAPNVTQVLIDGAINDPSNTDASVEVVLDTQIIAALVPAAQTRVYFAPNSYNGFYNAIDAAINQNCKVISISWGAPEESWESNELERFNSLFQRAAQAGCTITAAAGDNGSSDGLSGTNVDFPASSPWILAVGGTTVTANKGQISNEVVWNNNPTSSATGGGVSSKFDKPAYQSRLTGSKRGVPDVSANADPNTGYRIFMSGAQYVIGGTSAASPLWAALIARLNHKLGRNLGHVNPILYNTDVRVCRDITAGNNGAFTASGGWDNCTGCGSPDGAAFLNYLTVPVPTATASFNTQILSKKPFTVRFMDNSTSAVRWTWNFGDNQALSSVANSQNPIHIFTQIGSFTIRLTVTDKNGNTSTTTKVINVTK